MITLTPEPLASGFNWPEAPRWRDGKLFISDMFTKAVKTLTLDGKVETVHEVPHPAGLGWDPQGNLLAVSQTERAILQHVPGRGFRRYVDLSRYLQHAPNDMLVDSHGRAYVGNFGFDLLGGEAPKATRLLLVEPNGEVRAVADDLLFPNGMALSPDGKRLLVNESFAHRVTTFDVSSDGSLSNRKLFAQFGDAFTPDSLCLDEEGAVWVASFATGECVRAVEGGKVTHHLKLPGAMIPACMLAGPDRRTLVVLACHSELSKAVLGVADGRAWTVRVDKRGVGLP